MIGDEATNGRAHEIPGQPNGRDDANRRRIEMPDGAKRGENKTSDSRIQCVEQQRQGRDDEDLRMKP